MSKKKQEVDGMVRAWKRACILVLMFTFFLCYIVDAAQTTITFATYASALGTVENWNKLIHAFTEANPDIKVDVQVYTFGDYVNKITTMIAGGVAPDVLQVWAQYKAKWIETKFVRDISNDWEKSAVMKKAKVYPFMLDAAKYQGKLYGIPYDFNSVPWFYNLDWMNARGVKPPTDDWTVDDLRALAKKLTDSEARIYGTSNPVNNASGHNIQWIVNWAGHEWLNDDRTQVLIDRPAVVDMLNYWVDLQDNLRVAPYPGGFAAKGTFGQGGYGLVQDWLTGAFVYDTTAGFEWGYTTMPMAPKGQQGFAQGHMFGIASQSKHVDAAWRLVEWMASYEGQKATVNILMRQPIGPYTDLWDVFFQRLGPVKGVAMRDWVLNVFYGKDLVRNMTYWTTYPEMSNIVAEHVAKIFNQGAPAGNEMVVAAQRMQALLPK